MYCVGVGSARVGVVVDEELVGVGDGAYGVIPHDQVELSVNHRTRGLWQSRGRVVMCRHEVDVSMVSIFKKQNVKLHADRHQ